MLNVDWNSCSNVAIVHFLTVFVYHFYVLKKIFQFILHWTCYIFYHFVWLIKWNICLTLWILLLLRWTFECVYEQLDGKTLSSCPANVIVLNNLTVNRDHEFLLNVTTSDGQRNSTTFSWFIGKNFILFLLSFCGILA